MSEIEKLSKQLESFNNNLDQLDSYMENLFEYNNVDDLEKEISPVDSAKINNALAYSLNSLYFSKE